MPIISLLLWTWEQMEEYPMLQFSAVRVFQNRLNVIGLSKSLECNSLNFLLAQSYKIQIQKGSNERINLNQKKTRLFLSFFIVFDRLSIV